MTTIKGYFFDLDGTLTDAREGLYFCFRAALEALALPDLPDERLARFLGPPLPEMFRVLKPEISDAEINAGMAAFRAAYESGGIARNALYPGVTDMLAAIAGKDARGLSPPSRSITRCRWRARLASTAISPASPAPASTSATPRRRC